MSRIALLLSLLLTMAWSPLSAQEASTADRDRLILSSVAYLVNASVGGSIAIRDDLPMDFLGIRTGWSAGQDFFVTGTALSAPLPMLLTQAALTALATQPGRTGRRATTGLVILAGVAFLGGAAETITHDALRGREPTGRTLVVAGNLVIPAVMIYSGVRVLQQQ